MKNHKQYQKFDNASFCIVKVFLWGCISIILYLMKCLMKKYDHKDVNSDGHQ